MSWFKLWMIVLLSEPAVRAAQECPAGAGGFDAAGRLGPSLSSPLPRLRAQGFLSGRDLKLTQSQLAVDGFFQNILPLFAFLQRQDTCSLAKAPFPALDRALVGERPLPLTPVAPWRLESDVCCALGLSSIGQALALLPRHSCKTLTLLCAGSSPERASCRTPGKPKAENSRWRLTTAELSRAVFSQASDASQPHGAQKPQSVWDLLPTALKTAPCRHMPSSPRGSLSTTPNPPKLGPVPL